MRVDVPFGPALRQPDRLSCGASSLVVAHMLASSSYAALAAARFSDEVLAMHRRVTGPVDVAGRLQAPWPRALGTPPWAVARQLSSTGPPYATRLVRLSPARGWDLLLAAGAPAAVYVGSRTLPRHVVLALGPTADGAGVEVYDPATGGLRRLDRPAFTAARLRVGGWDVPWFVVAPHRPPRRHSC